MLWSFSVQLLSRLSPIVIYNPFFIAHHNLMEKQFVVTENERRQDLKVTVLKASRQLTRRPLIDLFHLSTLLQIWNNHRVVDVEFLGNFSLVTRGSPSITALSCRQLPMASLPLRSSSSKLLPPLQKFLNHNYAVCLLAVPGPNELLILRVVSIALWPVLNSNKKIAQILLFV